LASGKLPWQVLSRPEPPSLASKRLVTSWLYQPAPFGLVVGPRLLIEGAVVSILTVSDLSVWLVALSVAWQSTRCVPSPETEVVQVPARTRSGVRVSAVVPSLQLGKEALRPEPESLAVTVSVTELVLFQPAALAVWLTSRLGAIESCSVCGVVVSLPFGTASRLSAASVARV